MDALLSTYGSDGDGSDEDPSPTPNPNTVAGSRGEKAAQAPVRAFLSSLPPPKPTVSSSEQDLSAGLPRKPSFLSSLPAPKLRGPVLPKPRNSGPLRPGIGPGSDASDEDTPEASMMLNPSGSGKEDLRQVKLAPAVFAEDPTLGGSSSSRGLGGLLSALPKPKVRGASADLLMAGLSKSNPLGSKAPVKKSAVEAAAVGRSLAQKQHEEQQGKKKRLVSFTVPVNMSLLQGDDDDEDEEDAGKRPGRRKPKGESIPAQGGAKAGLAALLPAPKVKQALGSGYAETGDGEGWGGSGTGGPRLALDDDDDDEIDVVATAGGFPPLPAPHFGADKTTNSTRSEAAAAARQPKHQVQEHRSNEAFRVAEPAVGPSPSQWGAAQQDPLAAGAYPHPHAHYNEHHSVSNQPHHSQQVYANPHPGQPQAWGGAYAHSWHDGAAPQDTSEGCRQADHSMHPGYPAPAPTSGQWAPEEPESRKRKQRWEIEAEEAAAAAAAAAGGSSVVEVRQADLTKNRVREDQLRTTGIAFGPSYQPVSTSKDKPSKMMRRKHQISSLYFDMKAKEMELAERRSKGMLTKAETQAKYGWS